jgi:hypothetical protein
MIRYHIQGKKGKISGTSVAVRYHRYLKRFLRRRFPLVAFFLHSSEKTTLILVFWQGFSGFMC